MLGDRNSASQIKWTEYDHVIDLANY